MAGANTVSALVLLVVVLAPALEGRPEYDSDNQRLSNGQRVIAHPCDSITGTYQTWKSSATAVGIAVVGGGIAGLQAAKTLIQKGRTNVLVLEAENVLGGRVKTVRQGSFLVEEGAEWIHGGPQNPVYVIAQNKGAVVTNLLDSAWDWRVRKNNGQTPNTAGYNVVKNLIDSVSSGDALVPYYGDAYGQYYKDEFPGAYGTGWDSPLGRAWFFYLQKLINGEAGSNDWLDMAARDANEFTDLGEDHQWKNGYDTLIAYLKSTIPVAQIQVSSPVCKIYWKETDGKVLLVKKDGTSYSANQVIMTPSVGHLKERHQMLFQPALPAAYVQKLNGIELGVADKVIMGWNAPWWGSQKPLDLNILWTDFNLPSDMTWLYGVAAVFGVNQQLNVLETLITGNEAKQMESLPEATVKAHIVELLTNVTGLPVPEPTFFKRSQWYQNVWKRGAYVSYITPAGDAAGFRSREQMAAALTNASGKRVIFWSGEHTHNTRYGTVDGALNSGEREAMKIVNMLAG